MQVIKPFPDHLEDSLVLVCFADIPYDVFAVGAVDAEHLSCIILVFQLLEDLGVHGASELYFPARLALHHHT